jgi:hypothetical protein
MEYTSIGQAAPEIEGADEEPTEQSMLHATNDDVEVNNGIDYDNLDADHDDAEVDDDVDDDNLDADHDDDAPLRFCSINNIFGTVGFAPCALVVEEVYVVSSDKPTSFAKAERSPS